MFVPGIPGIFYREFAIVITTASVVSLIVSLTLSPAMAALLLKPHKEHDTLRKPGPAGHGRLLRRLCRTEVQRGLRLAFGQIRPADRAAGAHDRPHAGRLCRPSGADHLAAAGHPVGLHSGPGPGLPDRRHPAASRGLAGTDRGGDDPRLGDHQGHRRRRGHGRLRRSGRLQLLVRLQRRDHLHPARRLRRAQVRRTGRGVARRRHHRRDHGHRGRQHLRHRPARGPGSGQRQRLPDDGPGPLRRGLSSAGRRDLRHDGRRRRRAGSGGAGLLDLQHRLAAHRRRRRSRQGPDDGGPAVGRVQHARRLSGLVLRQRLQLPGPDLPRDSPGGALSRATTSPTSPICRPARPPAPWCRSARWPPAGGLRPGADRPLQPVPRGRAAGPGGGRRLVRSGDRQHGALAGKPLPPGFSYEWTGLALQEKQSSGGATVVFIMAVVFVFLVLAAQYESLHCCRCPSS
jgi:hypothetical protein